MSNQQPPTPEIQKIIQQFSNAKNTFLRNKGVFDGSLNDSINAMLDQVFNDIINPLIAENARLKQQAKQLETELKKNDKPKKKLPETTGVVKETVEPKKN